MSGNKIFVILTSQRTGSTYLWQWLNNHSRIRCHGEVFLRKHLQKDGFRHYCFQSRVGRFVHTIYSNRILCKLGLNLLPRTLVAGYLHRFVEDPAFPAPWIQYEDEGALVTEMKTVLGFKLMYSQLKATPELQRWLSDNNCAILHLIRENSLKRFVSLVRLQKTKVSHRVNGSFKSQPVELPIGRMMRFFRNSLREVQIHRDLYADKNLYHEITYEALFDDMVASRKEILTFLGLEDEEMTGSRLKKTSTNLIEREIVNHGEVIRALTGTEFEGYLTAYQY